MPLTSYSCAKCMAPFVENSETVMGGEGLHCPRCRYQDTIKYLKDELPKEFFHEFMTITPRRYVGQPDKPSPAAELLNERVLREYSRVTDEAGWKPWPGPQRDVHCWWELENGKAVGWNESPSKGWSFPVIALHNLKVWNGRGDYGFNKLDGRLYVCAPSAVRAVALLKQAGHTRMNMHEFKGYYAACWGISMANQKREEGVWFTPEGEDDVMGGYKPKRLV